MTRIALVIVLTVSAPAFALNPALDISQYAHTAWKTRDGFLPGATIQTVSQTPDGQLWLGTDVGLFRFDGVRTTPWNPPAGQPLPSRNVRRLLTGRDGTLWIGTDRGLVSWKDGTFIRYSDLDGRRIGRLLQDHEGTVWTTTYAISRWTLCAIQDGRARCYGDDGGPGSGAVGLYEDTKDNLWIGTRDGLMRWKPNPQQLFVLPPDANGYQAFVEDTDGTLLIPIRGGIARLVNGKVDVSYRRLTALAQVRGEQILRDRGGALWIGTYQRGLVHVHGGDADTFARADGLSGDYVLSLFEDREGSIWVVTTSGLDRFRELPVTTISAKQGLSAPVSAVLSASDGSVWLATSNGLYRWKDGRLTIPQTGAGKPNGKLDGQIPNSLFQDDRGRIWISTVRSVGYLDHERFVWARGLPDAPALSIAQDTRHDLWFTYVERGLIRMSRDGSLVQIPWSTFGQKVAFSLVPDLQRGGLWLGLARGGIAYFSDGEVRASFTSADGLPEADVNGLRLDADGTIWAATKEGLSRLKDGHAATLTTRNGLPCDNVHAIVEDDARSLWLMMPCGLVRLTRSEVDDWSAAVDDHHDATLTIHATVFDSFDGAVAWPDAGGLRPVAAVASDGRLWFKGADGVNVIDPRNFAVNTLPAPVRIEQFTADGHTYDVAGGPPRVPPLPRDLQIDYTAFSLVVPEKVRFRYKLEGYDADWRDAGNRRQAAYTNLPPRNYRFRVIAANNSGVWNEDGAVLDFAIAPAYYQTAWFRVLAVGLFTMLLATLYRLRVRQVARQYNARLEARIGERTRIARDLHDTLLQSFQGVLLKFHALSYLLGDRPEARQQLEAVIEQARQAITEGRDAVQGLRASTLPGNDLARAIITLGDELAVANAGEHTDLHVEVEGASRDLASLVHDDVYRIACEAVRNAYKHAGARRVEVEVHYGERQFRLRIRDDGKGIDAGVLRQGARAGHYGLPGMHERARAIGGTLTVWSEVNAGTEIDLIVPGAVAYSRASTVREPGLSRSGA